MENELSIDKARKPHAYIEFGGPGHETEYVFTTQANKYSEAQELPTEWENKLIVLLGEGWSIMNRGARIEIVPPNSIRTSETDSKLREAVKSLINKESEFVEIG